jgi:integrase/recombinase XerD
MNRGVTVIEGGQIQDYSSKEGLIGKFILSQDVTEKSRETYRKALKQFFSFLWDLNLELNYLVREHILSYKDFLKKRDLAANTVSAYLVAVRKFFEWTEAIKLYPNIARGIKGAKKPKGFRKDSLTVRQVFSVLGSISREMVQGKRDYAILNLLVRTGLRSIEIVKANIEDIRQEGGEAVLYIQGKGRESKDEFVLLTEEALLPIREYLTGREEGKESSPLFSSLSDRNKNGRLSTRSIRRIAKEHLKGAGIEDTRLTTHSFRHTAITLSLMAGASIQEAQALGRHANVNTTLVYAHNIDRLRNAPERRIESFLRAERFASVA